MLNKISNYIFKFVSSKLFLGLSISWFVAQAVYMTLRTNLGISPDETYHYHLIQLFAKNGWLPHIHNQYGMYSLGQVTHFPFFLYHYLLSLPYHIFSGSAYALVILRFMNIALALTSIYLLYKLAVHLKVSNWARNLGIFMLVNTLMFTFLSSSINYDNLLIPVTLASLLVLFRILEKPSLSKFLTLFCLILAGMMTAINFLVVALFVVGYLIYAYRHNLPQAYSATVKSWTKQRTLNRLLLIPSIALAGLFVASFGQNIIKYHTYSPGCAQVLSVEQCSHNGIFERTKNLPPNPPKDKSMPFEYFTSWGWSMREDTYGILGHKTIPDTKYVHFWTEAMVFAGIFLAIRYYRPSKNWNIIFVAAGFYGLVLFAKNYFGYLHTGYNLGVQGRYLFLFLPFAYFLFNDLLINNLRKRSLASLYILGTLAVFMVASLPTYIAKTSADWHDPGPITKHQR